MWRQLSAGWSSARGGRPGAGTRVDAVGQEGDALAFADPDDPVSAGGAEGRQRRDLLRGDGGSVDLANSLAQGRSQVIS